jgi:hypothetical protein
MRRYERCIRTERWISRHFIGAGAACLFALLALQIVQAQETTEKVTVDEVDRTFLVRLPKGYEAIRHYPVVVLLHGMNQEPDDMERLTGFDQLADKDRYLGKRPPRLDSGRSSFRSLQLWRYSPRDAFWKAGLSKRHFGRDHECDPETRSARPQRSRTWHSGGTRTDRWPLPGEEPSRALPVGP